MRTNSAPRLLTGAQRKQTMTKKYKYFQDPGHGWIAVPLAELKTLGIADQISEYSYILGPIVYLEEDCDAAIWHEAVKAKGEAPAFEEVHQDPTPIRGYPHYRGERGIQRTRSANVLPNAFASLFNTAAGI